MNDRTRRVQVGLVVAFAALGEAEEAAVETAWRCAAEMVSAWQPAFAAYGLDPIPAHGNGADLIVYLGESSRFEAVAGAAARNVPIMLVKSTVETLLQRPAGMARRYRMSTGVDGIAEALASVAPTAPTVDWRTLPWPESVKDLLKLDPDEGRYVTNSIAGFRTAAERRGIRWMEALPADDAPFSVFLTMHDPTAALLADAALQRWPGCAILAADGMVAMQAPDGEPWPTRLMRVRHWSPAVDSASNRRYREALGGGELPDFDSPGMLFGTLNYLDGVFAAGADAGRLEEFGMHEGPLGPMRMTPSGRPEPERLIVFQGPEMSVVSID